MKRTKQLMGVLLAAILVILSTACGSSTDDSGGDAQGQGNASTQTSSPASQETPAVDQSKQPEHASLYFDEPLSFTWMIAENGDIPLSNDIMTLNWLREHMNVDINILSVPESDYITKLSTMTATDSLPDVVDGSSAVIDAVAGSGMILNLSDYRDYMPDYLALIEGEDRIDNTNSYNYDGCIYGFQTLEDYRIGIAPLVDIRMDLLEKYQIPTPTSWEELYDAFLVIKENDPDNYVFSTRNGITYLLGNIAYSMGAGGYGATQSGYAVYFEPTDSRWTYGPTKPEFKNAVQYLANAYKDGLYELL